MATGKTPRQFTGNRRRGKTRILAAPAGGFEPAVLPIKTPAAPPGGAVGVFGRPITMGCIA